MSKIYDSKLFSCIFFLGLLSVSPIGNSKEKIPSNVWGNTFEQGYEIYYLKNQQNNSIHLECNVSTSAESEHSVSIESNFASLKNKFYYENDSELGFSFDGKPMIHILDRDTKSKKGSALWQQLIKQLHTASKIEVFIGNQKKATFYPTASSRKKELKEIEKNCKPMSLWQD